MILFHCASVSVISHEFHVPLVFCHLSTQLLFTFQLPVFVSSCGQALELNSSLCSLCFVSSLIFSLCNCILLRFNLPSQCKIFSLVLWTFPILFALRFDLLCMHSRLNNFIFIFFFHLGPLFTCLNNKYVC